MLSKELLKEKNIQTAEKLAVHFIALSSLLFLGKKNEAVAQLKTLNEFYNSLPEESYMGWSYLEAKNLIQHDKELPVPDKKMLLQQVQKLDPGRERGGYPIGQP